MRLSLILYLVLCGWSAVAQLAQQKRLELPVNPSNNENYALLPLAERGALVSYHHIEDYSRQPHRFQFIRLDTTLNTRWTVDYKLPERYVPLQTFDDEQYLYHLYTEPNTTKLAVLRLSLDDGTTDYYDGEMPSGLEISQFKVMGSMAYVAGYFRGRPVVMSFSFFDRLFRVFQGLYVNNMELGNVEVDPFRQEVHVTTYSPRKRCQFTVRSYSPDGKPLRIIEYDGTQYSLITGKMLPISADESLLVGNYSADCTPYSQGIYVTRIRHNETGKLTVTTDHGEAIRYFDFSKLKNFFNYLKPRRQQKLLARVERKQQLGKDYKFRYRLLVHDLMPTPNGLRLAAEVYYPLYKGTANSMLYTRNQFVPIYGAGNSFQMMPTNRPANDRVSSGYQYTHAFICEFDREGNLLWDNCLPIKDVSGPILRQQVQILPLDERVVLAYPKETEITTKLIVRDSVLRNDDAYKLLPSNETEKVQASAEETITAWYGAYFVATGYQKIIPDRGVNVIPREVFYLNKLRYNAKREK